MTNRCGAAALTGVIAVLLVAGCTIDGTATDQSVNLAELDTGPYQTVPSPPFGDADDTSITHVISAELGNHVVLPYEVDDAFSKFTRPTGILATKGEFTVMFGKGAAAVPSNSEFVSGFSTSGATSATDGDSIQHGVVRYTDDASATAAARELNEVAIAEPDQPEGVTTRGIAIPTVAGAVGNITNYRSTSRIAVRSYATFTDYVITTTIYTAAGEQRHAFDLIKKAYDLQSTMLTGIERQPTKAHNGGARKPLPIDPHSVLIYAVPTLPAKNDDTTTTPPWMILGPRAAAHYADIPQQALAGFTDDDVDQIASWGSIVYRTSTSEHGSHLRDRLVSDAVYSGAAAIDPPRALPIARCTDAPASDGAHTYACRVAVGRYVGEMVGSDLTAVHQGISAQYAILTHADQDAA